MATHSPIRPAEPLLGAHFSIAGGLYKAMETAQSLECNAAQIFTKNASTWKERSVGPEEIERFAAARTAAGVGSVASHTSYLINPASPDEKLRARSCKALGEELLRSAALDPLRRGPSPGRSHGPRHRGWPPSGRRQHRSRSKRHADTRPSPAFGNNRWPGLLPRQPL